MEESGELKTICSLHDDISFQNYDKQNEDNELCCSIQKPDETNFIIDRSDPYYQILIDSLLEGIIIIDSDGKIQYCNQTFLHILGYSSPSELEGLFASSFISEDYVELFNKHQKQTCLGRGGFLPTYKAKKKDGSIIWIDGLSCMVSYKKKAANIFFIRDITKQKNIKRKMKQLEKKYRTIAELSANGIVTMDPLGKIMYANKSFEMMTRKNGKQLKNSLFRELLTEDYIYIFQQLLMKVRKKNENIRNVEMEIKITSEQINPIEISIAPINEDDAFIGFICTLQDIKERKRFENEIKTSERLKTEFMNIAAHELKSPVTPIKGYLDLIVSDEKSDEKIKKWAKISLRNAERLLRLVDDILDVSRLDNDTMKFEMRKIDPTSLFHEIGEDMTPSIEKKQLAFTKNLASDLPEILGDYLRLNQVLRNLFTNAIKFTDEGSIKLEAYRKDDNIVFEVSDTGIGMRKDEASNVFKKFYQTETSDNRKHEGTGLGLFICKEILKKHHGDIQVDSTLGKGSRFIVTLPIL